MTSEDAVAAKLKGTNCLIKFHDGEELLLKIPFINDDDAHEFIEDSEAFLNGNKSDVMFPGGTIALSRSSVKYIRLL